MSTVNFKIDGKSCTAESGQTIVQAAEANGIYIPVLCHHKNLKPAGACRVCTVKVGGRNMAACHTPVSEGMIVENTSPELENMRKAIIEMLFVEGNHMCPSCEKSGNCELQALGYRYRVFVPRFPYLWQKFELDATSTKIFHDKNRCIKCMRCTRGIASKDGKHIFGLMNRGEKSVIEVDDALASQMSDEQAEKAMALCPVGAIIHKEKGFAVPIGERRFDGHPIGSDIGK